MRKINGDSEISNESKNLGSQTNAAEDFTLTPATPKQSQIIPSSLNQQNEDKVQQNLIKLTPTESVSPLIKK